MSIARIRTSWQGYSPTKKWIVGGVGALLLLGAAGSGQDQHGQRGAGFAAREAVGGLAGGPGYAGGYPGGAGSGYSVQPSSAGSAGGSYAAPGGEPVDIMSGYEAQQASQAGSARAFGQYMRDQTDVTDSRTGDITTDVPNEIANPAIESGTYTATPEADVAAASAAGEE